MLGERIAVCAQGAVHNDEALPQLFLAVLHCIASCIISGINTDPIMSGYSWTEQGCYMCMSKIYLHTLWHNNALASYCSSYRIN